jgi:long-chain acyl-CoA synthetase
MKVIESDYKLGELIPNIPLMLRKNSELYGKKTVFRHRINGKYEGINWEQFTIDISNIAANLRNFGFSKGDKIVTYSKNRYEMLVLELALMSSGGVSVPIFFNYNTNNAEALITHSGAKFLAVGDQ